MAKTTTKNYPNRVQLEAAERGAIIAERPLYNKMWNGPDGSIHSYSLAEVGADYLSHLKDPERWLRTRLNRGELRGIKHRREWRMRERDVESMLDLYSNHREVEERDRRLAAEEQVEAQPPAPPD
jgi:hypothetical protein